jgi:hypothetical protein
MSDPAFQRNGVFNFRGLPRGKSQIVIPMTSAKTPTEIRDKIYTYSIPDEDAVLAPNRQERNSSLHPKRPQDTLQLAPPHRSYDSTNIVILIGGWMDEIKCSVEARCFSSATMGRPLQGTLS